MNFLNPGFLFALAAVAIPVIIHLFNFRRFKKVYFSNVQFLKDVKEQNSSKEKLKNLLILLARILAILFLVLAFARPFISSKQQTAPGAAQVVSIYIDNSYSMETVNKEGSLLDNAKRNAIVIAKTFNLNARFKLVTNDFEGRHQRLLNFEEFKDAVQEVKISSADRTLKQVINRQQNTGSKAAAQYSYVISDFQKNFSGDQPITLDSNTVLALVKLNANGLPNVSADSAWFLSPVHRPNAAENLVIRLRNYSDEDAENIPLKLNIDGVQKAISSLNIPAGQSKTDTLNFAGLAAGWHKGELTIKDYPLTFDDQLRFTFKVNQGMKVLAINGGQTGRYLKALFGVDEFFSMDEMTEQNINYTAFSRYKLIILNGLNEPSSGLAQQLRSYLGNGGSVVIFPNLDADKNVFSSLLNSLSLPPVTGLVNEEGRVTAIDLKNPLFKDLFESLPRNIDLPKANRFYTFATSATGREDLMRMPAERSFLSAYRVGAGKAYLFATGLDTKDSNLPKHPFFVPMLYKIAFSSIGAQRMYYTVGRDNMLETEKIELGANQSLKLVSDNFEAIPELNQYSGTPGLYIADQVRNAGFYDLVKADSTLSVYAFNNAGAESDMQYSSQGDLQALFGNQPVSFFDTRKDSLPAAELMNSNGTELWKLCLVLAILFLAAEILLIRFFNTKTLRTA